MNKTASELKERYEAPYTQFKQWIVKNGQQFPKKHGEWRVVQVLSKWFILDTWNGQLTMCDREPVPTGRDVWNNVVTFRDTGDTLVLAYDFGERRIEHPVMLHYYYCHAHPLWIKL